MIDRRQRLRLYLERGWTDTWHRVQASGEDLGMSVAAAVTVSLAVATGFSKGDWVETFTAALAAGVGTILVYFFLLLAVNLAASPRQVRRDQQMPVAGPNEFPGMAIAIKIPTCDHDLMQREAWVIVRLIDDHLDAVSRGVQPPYDREWIEQRIAHFGRRAKDETWISGTSRRRSLELHVRMTTTNDLAEIREMCQDFLTFRPSH